MTEYEPQVAMIDHTRAPTGSCVEFVNGKGHVECSKQHHLPGAVLGSLPPKLNL